MPKTFSVDQDAGKSLSIIFQVSFIDDDEVFVIWSIRLRSPYIEPLTVSASTVNVWAPALNALADINMPSINFFISMTISASKLHITAYTTNLSPSFFCHLTFRMQ